MTGHTKLASLTSEGILRKIDDDEPIFVLRATDKFAPEVIRFWAALLRQANNSPSDKEQDALECATEMEDWQAKNDCKVPD